MAKLNCQQPKLKYLMSHDPLKIILIYLTFAAQETFLIISNVENSCVAEYIYIYIYLFQVCLINIMFKRIQFTGMVFFGNPSSSSQS